MSVGAESRGHGMLEDQETPAEDAVLLECTAKSWLDNIEPEKLQVFADMYDSQSCTDVVIQCCYHQLIHAHRHVLAARSQLFNVALKKSSRKCAVLEVKYLPFKYIKALVDLIYHNQVLVARVDAGRMLYLIQQFQLRGAFGENGVEGLLLRLSGTKLLGEHFDHLFQYTYATPVTKARLPRETQRLTSVAEPPKCVSRDRRKASEPAAPINRRLPTTITREPVVVLEAVPIDQVKLKVEDVKTKREGAPGLESGNTQVETVEEVDQKPVTTNRKGRGSGRSRVPNPTEASFDRFTSLAAPGEYPQPPRAASRRSEKPRNPRQSLAAPGEYPQPPRAASRRSEKPRNPRQVAVTSIPKAKIRTAAANTKLCLDALVLGSSQYNVDTDGNKIPRPPNAFMIFGQDFRKLLAGENHGESNKAVSVALGRAWGALTDCERQAYYELQELYKQQHQTRYPGYVYCPAHARRQKALRRRT